MDFRLSELQQKLASGDLSLISVVEQFLHKIAAHRHLNAFIEVFETEAITRAEHVQEKIRQGKAGRLYGLVAGIKDNICYKGHKATAASNMLQNFESLITATAVERMLQEDAILIGRLNCDEFGMGSTNENSVYGPVCNFLDPSRVAGGSSGGCAVAVQAGLCHVALGSDTGGSVRTPASFCGVVGFKPSYGVVSRHGLIAYASSFDQIGILASGVDAVIAVLNVIAGPDEYDSTLIPRGLSRPEPAGNPFPRIAYFRQALEHQGLDTEIKSALQHQIAQLRDCGHVVDELDFPLLDYLVPSYYILTTAEASSNLSRYDGVRYGYRSAAADQLETLFTRSRSEGFGREVKRRIMLGTFVLSAGYQDAYYARAQKVRQLIFSHTRKIFSEYDFILSPATPTIAWRLGEMVHHPVEMYLSDVYTVHANLAGLPAVSLPMGTHSTGMPFGVQLMAARYADLHLLEFARLMMQD
ncbi:MAG: glutamyl-tRNA(Gln) amidotransferase subunit A [Chitinophagales bacterium]|nr:MAG: glutamyl-tRNA(Gln) amidotransferase subunit A [Chitinophagales bacterium]